RRLRERGGASRGRAIGSALEWSERVEGANAQKIVVPSFHDQLCLHIIADPDPHEVPARRELIHGEAHIVARTCLSGHDAARQVLYRYLGAATKSARDFDPQHVGNGIRINPRKHARLVPSSRTVAFVRSAVGWRVGG